MTKIILILSLLFLAGCADWNSKGSCYWDYGKRSDKLYCYSNLGGWTVERIVEKRHKRRHR